MADYIIVSFSGGKDSTAMLLRMIELGERIDEVLCCDTYMEFPAMYRHIAKVKKIVEDNGIKFTELRSDKSFEYYMFEHISKRAKQTYKDKVGFSWAGPMTRWCTTRLKTDIVKSYMAKLKKQYKLIQCLGIAFDEEYRLKRNSNKLEYKKYPLVEWQWTEEQCLAYCYGKGFDWEGLYEIFRKEGGRCPRVSCWCCPLQSLDDLRILRKSFPDLWEKLNDMDKKTWRTFKADYSVEQLEVRFAFEDERRAEGKSVTDKEFYAMLNVKLGRDNTDKNQIKIEI